ncbi:MAG TPA: DUF6036 family nucleotidyltransferase [Acidimicrobiales bacterium]|nr:DUF6036 family nucleotidyltransferase [Acidimicrobiales bacterium]
MLSRERILRLFAELDQELRRIDVRGDVFVVGGAAMTVAYDARPATRDVDAIWHPSTEVREAAAAIAGRHDDLEPDWLNDAVKGFLPGPDPAPRVVYDGDFLSVSAASPEYLLATKLLASRVSRDEADIVLLYDVCGLTSVDEGLEVVERYYPGRPIEAKVRFFLEELIGDE